MILLFSRIGIRTRIFGAFFLVLGLLSVLAVMSLRQVVSIGGTIDSLVRSADGGVGIADVRSALQRSSGAIERFTRTSNLADRQTAAQMIERVTQRFTDLAAKYGELPGLAAGKPALVEAFDFYSRAFQQLTAASDRMSGAIAKLDQLGAMAGGDAIGVANAVANLPAGDAPLVQVFRLSGAVDSLRNTIDRYLRNRTPVEADEAQMALTYANLAVHDAKAEVAPLGGRLKRLVDKLEADLSDNKTAFVNATTATTDMRAAQDDLAKAIAAIDSETQKITAMARADREDEKTRTDGAIRGTYVMVVTVAAIAIMLGALLAWFIGMSVSDPILSMTRRMQSLAAGEFEAPIPGGNYRDEIGQMAQSVEVFRQAAVEKQRLEADAARSAARAEAERTARDADKAREMRDLQVAITALGEGMERLSSGDLVYRIDNPLTATVEKLRADFNRAVDKLQQTMSRISDNTLGIRSGTDEIAKAADDLSRRTEQQAAAVEETAATLNQITATVRKTAEGASHARAIVTAAHDYGEKSAGIVREAISAMSGIEASSQQIGQIIGVIDEIAFQTNLLALNAGVEAARAGDAGRGFAVVASEVRALAQRSAEAAKEIKTLISTSTGKIRKGVDLVGKVGASLEQILAQVAEINTVVHDIAVGAREQAAGLQQVNTAVSDIDKGTQQNAAMVEQSTAATHSLAGESDGLTQLVKQFRLDHGPAQGRHVQAAPTTTLRRRGAA